MVTSKYCKFGYASMCGNILKNVLQLTPHYFVPRAPPMLYTVIDIEVQKSLLNPNKSFLLSVIDLMSVHWAGKSSVYICV